MFQNEGPSTAAASFLSFGVGAAKVREDLEPLLRTAGHPMDALDLSDQECILLAALDLALPDAPTWMTGPLGEALRAPAKSRGSGIKLRYWVLQHWARSHVRETVAKQLRAGWILHPFRKSPPELAGFQTLREQGVAWVQALWSAWQTRQVDWARQAWGAEDWDRHMEAFLAQVRPVLWVTLLRPELERLIDAQHGVQRIEELSAMVRGLSWEASVAKNKHQLATGRVGALQEEVEILREALVDQAERIRALEETLVEERKAWAELLIEMQSSRTTTGQPQRAQFLAGKRVAVVGGDPIAPGAVATVEALGGEAVFCPGFDHIARVSSAVEGADLVVAVATYMSHRHADAVKAAVERTGARVIWVNSTGLTAFRRALQTDLKTAG